MGSTREGRADRTQAIMSMVQFAHHSSARVNTEGVVKRLRNTTYVSPRAAVMSDAQMDPVHVALRGERRWVGMQSEDDMRAAHLEKVDGQPVDASVVVSMATAAEPTGNMRVSNALGDIDSFEKTAFSYTAPGRVAGGTPGFAT